MSLPKGWINVQVKDITEINPRTKDIDDDIKASFIPMTLVSEDFGVPAKDEVKSWGEIKKGYTHFKDGDVILAKNTP